MGKERHDWENLSTPSGNYSLERLVETRLAVLRHVFFDDGAKLPRHRHERPLLVYGVGGPCVEMAQRSEIVRRRLVYRPAGYEHALDYFGPTHLLVFEISDRNYLPGLEDSVRLPANLYDRVWAVMLELTHGGTMETIAGSIAALLDCVRREALSTRPGWFEALLDEIHDHWQERASTSALAGRFGLSPEHLCREFKRHTGMTLTQYSLALKIDHARGLLWGTKLPIAEVAAQAGFFDQSHLTRALAAHSELTPLRLRWHAPCLRDLPFDEIELPPDVLRCRPRPSLGPTEHQ